MELSEKQIKRLKKIAKVLDEGDMAIAELIVDVEDKIQESQDKICEDIYNIPQKDYTEKLDTILSKLDEPEEITVELNIT
jgi:hypothetical protein